MASIVLSFVGSQDPYSEKTNQEGSIVTLVRHLIGQKQAIKKIFLLYTTGTNTQAEDTKNWINIELNIHFNSIETFPVSQEFSDDPINLALAIPEIHRCLDKAIDCRENNDSIEFNATSGTPVMKMGWGILQALGYASNSRIWQIRNPSEMKFNQERVFANTINVFKNESDLKVIKKQLENYNYGGALQTLERSEFNNKIAKAFMEYGYYRLAFDFKSAREAIKPYQQQVKSELVHNIEELCNEHILELLQEAYYKGILKIKTKQYADFLVLLFSFQENMLKFLVKQQLLESNLKKLDWKNTKDKIRSQIEQGELNKYLKSYHYNGKLLNLEGKINRIVMLAIVNYFSDLNSVKSLLKELESYCQDRNDLVHELKGVSELKNEEKIIKSMRQIMEFVKPDFDNTNPFNSLNEQILNQLTPILRG